LDRQFDQSLSEFDAQLARKQREIDAQRRESPDPALSRGGGAMGSPGSPTSAGSGKAGETGAGTESRVRTEPTGSSGEQAASARTAGASRSGARRDDGTLEPGTPPSGETGSRSTREKGDARYTGADPPNLPDPADDDVVARQLREAAEKEADPAIRARLWEEYLEYRRSTGSAKR
jgi:hypothetical protein